MTVTGMKGKQYHLDSSPLASGGEGNIYCVLDTDLVAKIYMPGVVTIELEKKLWVMVEDPPDESILSQVAWPIDMAYDQNRKFCGFIMKKMEIDSELGEIYKYPSALAISMEQKISIAFNICVVMEEVHRAGYVFGDFNPRNIGLNTKTGIICFLDTDTYHVKDPVSDEIYRCNVCAPGYVAPELLQKCSDFTAAHPEETKDVYANMPLPTFTQETDNFALAIHIFKLLMNGYTPFGGIIETASVSQSSPGVGDAAVRRDSYCFRPGYKAMSPAIPPLEALPEEIADLFTRAFIEGKANPMNRPNAVMWQKALTRFERNLVPCKNDAMHHYDKLNLVCPLCEADKRYEDAISADYVSKPSGRKSSTAPKDHTPLPGPVQPPKYIRTESGRRFTIFDEFLEKLDRRVIYGVVGGIAILIVLYLFVLQDLLNPSDTPQEHDTPVATLNNDDDFASVEPTEAPIEPEATEEPPEPTTAPVYIDDEAIIQFSIGSPIYSINGVSRFGFLSPVFNDGRNMMPLRMLADLMGARIEWVAPTALLITSDDTVRITIDEPLPENIGAPILIDGSIFVPFRYAADILGGEISVNNSIISISVDKLPIIIKPTTIYRFTFDTEIFTINGTRQLGEATPFINNENAMLPLQTLANIMNAEVTWDEITREAVFYYGDNMVLKIPVGMALPDSMGTPILQDENVFIPFKYAASILNAELHWYSRLDAIFLVVEDD